jgi:glycosyltransferase involved in cell wall biosynthesis
MAKCKVLHLVGGEVSVWRLNQLAAQYRLLPDELFDQKIATGEEPVARKVENLIFQPVQRLRRRLHIEYSAARNLNRLLKAFGPSLIICWDIPATEQLRWALRGSRRRVTAGLMLFQAETNPELLSKLKQNYQDVGLHLFCASQRLGRWVKEEIGVQEKIHCIYPVFEQTAETLDRKTLREQMGLERDAIGIFVPAEGRIEDLHLALIGCGINEKIYSNLRIVVAGADQEREGRIRRYTESTIVPRILRVIQGWDVRVVLGVCDLVVQPVSRYSETLALVEAFGRGVPVISTRPAEPAELMIPNETYWDLEKTIPRAVAGGMFKILSDGELRNKLTKSAQEAVRQKCLDLDYRARIVKLYQQVLSPGTGGV